MEYIVFIIFLVVAIAGLITLIFGLPGNFIVLIDTILYGWYGGFSEITFRVIVALVLLSLLGELLEFLIGITGLKKYKSSNKAIVGSIVGGIVGAIWGAPFLLGIGSIIGAFIGAFAGAFLVELLDRKGASQAIQSGWGAFVGRLGGTITKGVIGIAMVSIAIFSIVRN